MDCLGVINGNRKPALVKTESFLAITMAKVTRKNARQESTIMIAISQDNLSAVEPASDHSLSREMHLKAEIDYCSMCTSTGNPRIIWTRAARIHTEHVFKLVPK